jgi:hypothetical protein
MATPLIEMEPRHAYPTEGGWILQIGEMVVGKNFGNVYLTQPTPYYVVYTVLLGETKVPELKAAKQRDLTPEEVAIFEEWAQKAEREMKEAERQQKRAEHQQRRGGLAQQQNAISDATGGKVLL